MWRAEVSAASVDAFVGRYRRTPEGRWKGTQFHLVGNKVPPARTATNFTVTGASAAGRKVKCSAGKFYPNFRQQRKPHSSSVADAGGMLQAAVELRRAGKGNASLPYCTTHARGQNARDFADVLHAKSKQMQKPGRWREPPQQADVTITV